MFQEQDHEELLEDSCQMTVDSSENIFNTLKNLYFDKNMCDVFLMVGTKEHGAHRLILCAFSDVFQAMLMKPEWSEWHESRIVLQESPECEPVFHLFLEYFYTGKIILTHTNVMPILSLADKYIVKVLVKLCLEYMYNHIPHAASHNQLFLWLQYSMNCGHTTLADYCQNYIKWNLESVANTPDFSNFEAEVFSNLLSKNDLVIYNEFVLYNCVARWLDLQRIRLHQSDVPRIEIEQHMQGLVELVMGRIRFPMMSPRELADLLLSPLIKQYKDFLLERMTMGMVFHNGQKDQIPALCPSEEQRRLFVPRIYISDHFSSILSVDNIYNVPCYNTRTFVFSSHMSTADCESDKINEWVVDLYPKGVWFKKCFLIVSQGMLEVPEEVIKTVRLSLTCRELAARCMQVHIAVLLYGKQGETEHIMKVVRKVHTFDEQERAVVFDNLLPFLETNRQPGAVFHRNPHLVGPNNDQLKLNIVITPVCSIFTNNDEMY